MQTSTYGPKAASGYHHHRSSRGYRSSHVTLASAASDADGKARTGALRRVILLRHADSESPAGLRDIDRPISAEGKKQAAETARILKSMGWVPDVVLASNAKRTRQTLDEMTSVIEGLGAVDAHLYGSLYTVAALDGQTRQHIEECILEVVDDKRNHCVAVVGHNKGMEEAASSFAGAAVKLKTASAALLQCVAESWSDVLGTHTAELKKGAKDEDWASHQGVKWELVGVIGPSSA